MISVVALVAVLAVIWLLYSRFSVSPQQNTVAQRAAEQVAEVENPFKASNPLIGVKTNPFDKAKKVLNPFEQ